MTETVKDDKLYWKLQKIGANKAHFQPTYLKARPGCTHAVQPLYLCSKTTDNF